MASTEAAAAAAAAVGQEEEEEEADMKVIAEEYKVWKKNTPFLYDLVLTHALEWPSLTVQWLDRKTKFADKDYSEQELLMGTHTADGAQNHLLIARVRLPNETANIDARKYDDERGELGGYGGTASKIEVKVRINHDGEVNRARYMPQDDYIVGTKTNAGEVHVFYVRDHESKPAEDSPAQPDVRCAGHNKEGYGLDWSPQRKGHILSSSDDGSICHWDINGKPDAKSKALDPLHSYSAHGGTVVGDVQWHCKHQELFGSIGDDGAMCLWDLRAKDAKPIATAAKAHEKGVNTLSFSPFNDYLSLTGGSDKVIKLWDQRNLNRPLHVFEGHTDEIYKVEWAPFSEAIMASCGADRRVMVWDLSRIGDELNPEDTADGAPELLFVHGGHTATVNDFSWNTNDPWTIASVAEDNVVQVFQLAAAIYADDTKEGTNLSDADLE
ncbi:Histone-binding protein RBBP4 [Hondaea fermentalgiana]|uniref:Histone-binding protein RBBP4 n=1 Tax=Hondaea fermentalgiana TaxID=2315210 RepID=A0A2R5GW00_9STRA|nr:Histone-binding protein RBBP4 [Hondaea fermentalgiana]|eukprot:GBG32591.1 Histone-binding protein RBBP4 [Hondaea fermentalgiana]